ncbi:IGR protein motif-domain-containing protein [Mycena rosella]|uniref:Small ribosomal subunit protein mS41 n=1 Tax=Mycena rosella TaxID=1033263 RepID=A0AAD7GB00_MYCRO|nr:IGR protein motif-domain-containing protein [Mycena rosella]
MNSLLSSGSRLCSLAPRTCRSLATATKSRPVPSRRGIHNLLPTASQIPLIRAAESITTPEAFLKAIGRSADTKVSVESWDEFWQQSSANLKSAGVGVRDRRYILWCMEKYRSGLSVEEFAHEPRPKKTVRGWGPTVQDGKRIRSRRDRTK